MSPLAESSRSRAVQVMDHLVRSGGRLPVDLAALDQARRFPPAGTTDAQLEQFRASGKGILGYMLRETADELVRCALYPPFGLAEGMFTHAHGARLPHLKESRQSFRVFGDDPIRFANALTQSMSAASYRVSRRFLAEPETRSTVHMHVMANSLFNPTVPPVRGEMSGEMLDRAPARIVAEIVRLQHWEGMRLLGRNIAALIWAVTGVVERDHDKLNICLPVNPSNRAAFFEGVGNNTGIIRTALTFSHNNLGAAVLGGLFTKTGREWDEAKLALRRRSDRLVDIVIAGDHAKPTKRIVVDGKPGSIREHQQRGLADGKEHDGCPVALIADDDDPMSAAYERFLRIGNSVARHSTIYGARAELKFDDRESTDWFTPHGERGRKELFVQETGRSRS